MPVLSPSPKSSLAAPRLAAAISRLGTESAFEVLARAEALKRRGRDVINLGIGQPDFPTPPHVVEAAVKALRDGHHGYTPANGILPLREAVAADLEARLGAKVDPDCVVIVPGAKMTMFFAVLMFGEPDAEIIYPDPGFPIYQSLIRFAGARPVPMVLREDDGFSFKAEDVLALVTPATRLLILNSPANPTGGAVPKAEMGRLAAGLERHPRVAILSDEIYGRIIYGGRAHASLLAYPPLRDRLILLDGWSKTYAMTGWRLGFGVWPRAWVEAATRLAINSHSCVNAAAQWAGIAALQGPQDAVETMVRAFDERRLAILSALNRMPGMRCAEPGGAFYVFPNIEGTGMDSRTLQDRLLDEAGVATIAGTSFGDAGERFIRFSYAASLPRIEEAMARIRAFLTA
ncbi:MAG: pyridoxal phosphate-dependent aminotransferase [Rhodospirillales bacterium]|nr:pyridoxal phosphate-dependent aminotransferase [Rhodospirillales bacterium]